MSILLIIVVAFFICACGYIFASLSFNAPGMVMCGILAVVFIGATFMKVFEMVVK